MKRHDLHELWGCSGENPAGTQQPAGQEPFISLTSAGGSQKVPYPGMLFNQFPSGTTTFRTYPWFQLSTKNLGGGAATV